MKGSPPKTRGRANVNAANELGALNPTDSNMATPTCQEPLLGTPWPSDTTHRRTTSLDGTWSFTPDPDDTFGHDSLPAAGRLSVAVPASWNEQIPHLDGFLGPAWYEREVWAPMGLDPSTQRLLLRFGSVNYEATVWFNGVLLGSHTGGHLPFELEVPADTVGQGGGPLWRDDAPNRLTVRVDGRLARTQVPPGGGWGAMAPNCHPNTSFDFYPYAGIQRSVSMLVRPRHGLEGLRLRTELPPSGGADLHISAKVGDGVSYVTATLANDEGSVTYGADGTASNGTVNFRVHALAPQLWAPGSPHLYTLCLTMHAIPSPQDSQSSDGAGSHKSRRVDAAGSSAPGPAVLDRYQQKVGLRTVAVVGDQLLLNGSPIVLRGFGRHEDFPLIGRGDCGAVLRRDHACLAWVGANSYV